MQVPTGSSVCPRCGQRAPIVLRGLEARCTACGGQRPPFVSTSVTLAGQPSRVGGVLAQVSGWIVLVLGFSIALFLGLLLGAIWPGSLVGWAFSVPIALLSLFFGGGLAFGGRRLQKSGDDARKRARIEAVRALVAHRGGTVTAADAAQALNVSEAECDVLLTDLAKDPDQNVSLEVDDDGRIRYLFGVAEQRWRVLEENAKRAEGLAAVQDSESLDTDPARAAREREAKN